MATKGKKKAVSSDGASKVARTQANKARRMETLERRAERQKVRMAGARFMRAQTRKARAEGTVPAGADQYGFVEARPYVRNERGNKVFYNHLPNGEKVFVKIEGCCDAKSYGQFGQKCKHTGGMTKHGRTPVTGRFDLYDKRHAALI